MPAKQPAAAIAAGLPATFHWTSTAPLVSPASSADRSVLSVKDPTVVYFNSRWHLFATTASTPGGWNMIYANFADWSQAASAVQHRLDAHPAFQGYHCAPQVFYFRPQKKWYLIYQSGQPQYSTADDLSKPETWTKPVDFFTAEPAAVKTKDGKAEWLDFWVICDERLCHMFFTNDNGIVYRSQTRIEDFPKGFGEPVVAMRASKEALYEASCTYRVKGTSGYLTLVEAFGPDGSRFYRSFVAPSLDGEWSPLADTWEHPFAGQKNVGFEGAKAWTQDISHGELLRDGYDETLTIDPKDLRFLYQGVDPARRNVEYFQLPYRLGLLTLTK